MPNMDGAYAKIEYTCQEQMTLPRLPIPEIKDTLAAYVQSVQPWLEEMKHEGSSNKATSPPFQEVVQTFQTQLAPILQERLIAHDQTQPYSWLERWWLSLAYHTWREPLVIHSNWYIAIEPTPLFAHGEEVTRLYASDGRWANGFSKGQIVRASGLVVSFLEYHKLILSGQIEDRTKSGSLCLHQYTKLFGICRIPLPGEDALAITPTSNYITVLVRGFFYILPVRSDPNSILPVTFVQKALLDIVNHASTRRQGDWIGVCSGAHRDTWASLHGNLTTLNGDTLKTIQSSLFCLALDDYTVGTCRIQQGRNLFHGRGGRNRWFDAALTIIVSADGYAGVNGEHSPCDALVPAMLVDFAAKRELPPYPAPAYNPYTGIVPFRSVDFSLTPENMIAIKACHTEVLAAIKNSDVNIVHFKSFGSAEIKKFAKVSPDAFVQMCLQLTFYRLNSKFVGVYETASTRQFRHGRTETCRSASLPCKRFVQAFDHDAGDGERLPALRALFDAACKYHSITISRASQGRGVDRHLLGLRLCLQPGEDRSFFDHPLFKTSGTWVLSTSALFAGERITATGFGAGVEHGYGMNYMIASNQIKIGIESKYSCEETSSRRYGDMLQRTFQDVMRLCRATEPPAASKL